VKSKERAESFKRLLDRGLVIKAEVEGIDLPLYIAEADRGTLNRAICADSAPAPRASILAPLDNVLWDRGLIRVLFDFDYVWEVYKPLPERKYGYYVLPILYGDRFIARFEPGRDRDNGALVIKQWWWEPGVNQTKAMKAALIDCFRRFLSFLNASEIHGEKRTIKKANLSWLNSY
jgi:uncharacterized protein YcaQ